MSQNQYPFCKFTIPEKGKRVIWELTNECNYGCKYCIFSSTGRKPVGELTTEECFSLLRQLKENGFTHIKYTGGEPFLREDILDVLNYTQSLGFQFNLSTNASKINSNMAQYLSSLNTQQFSMIHISLDGHTQEIHEKVRGKKSFTPTIEGLQFIIDNNKKIHQKPLYIRIGCVIHKGNENHISDMVYFCEKLGVNEIIFSLMEPVGRLKGKFDLVSQRDISSVAQEIEYLKNTYSTLKISHNLQSQISSKINNHPDWTKIEFLKLNQNPNNLNKKIVDLNNSKNILNNYCPGGQEFIFINSIGNVSPCTWVSEYKNQFAQKSIKNISLTHILNEMKYFREIAGQLSGICPMEQLDKFNKIMHSSHTHEKSSPYGT